MWCPYNCVHVESTSVYSRRMTSLTVFQLLSLLRLEKRHADEQSLCDVEMLLIGGVPQGAGIAPHLKQLEKRLQIKWNTHVSAAHPNVSTAVWFEGETVDIHSFIITSAAIIYAHVTREPECKPTFTYNGTVDRVDAR